MTYFSALQRGLLYVLIAALTQAVADLQNAFGSDWLLVTKFYLQLVLTGAITWRAFIDSSSSQVKDSPPNQPVVDDTPKS